MIDPVQTALLAAIAFGGALIYGITGFGTALVTIPLATHIVPLPFALALFALSDLASALRIGLENPRNVVRAEWLRLAPTILAGTALGATLLVKLPRDTAMLLLGLFVLAYSAYTLARPATDRIISSAWGWVAGLGGGITGTLFGAGGPPYAIYLSQRGLDKAQFRATMGFASVTSISLRVAAFLITGLLLDLRIWLTAAAVIPCALLGIATAQLAFSRISREALMRAVSVMLLASGGSLIARALG